MAVQYISDIAFPFPEAARVMAHIVEPWATGVETEIDRDGRCFRSEIGLETYGTPAWRDVQVSLDHPESPGSTMVVGVVFTPTTDGIQFPDVWGELVIIDLGHEQTRIVLRLEYHGFSTVPTLGVDTGLLYRLAWSTLNHVLATIARRSGSELRYLHGAAFSTPAFSTAARRAA